MIYAKKLLKFNEIVHGFTTRKEGNLGLGNLGALGFLDRKNLVLANQVHKNNIETVEVKDKGGLIVKTDGLITKDKGIILGIRTADCVPLLFYEPVAKIIGAVHAGWRGSLLKIIGKMIRQICQIGGISKNIICVIGPHICDKCYEIPKERQKLFEKKYIKGEYLDLSSVNIDQLLEMGIKRENIEVLPYCTFHQNEQFFSYRKNKKDEDYGEMLAYIGLI